MITVFIRDMRHREVEKDVKMEAEIGIMQTSQ